VLIDNAGGHVSEGLEVPANLTLVHLPPYSPELNAIERLWQYLRDRYLSGCLFRDLQAVIDECCRVWNALLAEQGRIQSLTNYNWARAHDRSNVDGTGINALPRQASPT